MIKIYFFTLCSVLLGCAKNHGEQQKFLNIELLNSKLIERTDFDILELMTKTDSVYAIDSNFYIDLMEQMSGGIDKKCFQRATIPYDPISINGKVLNRIKEKDSIARLFLISFSESIVNESLNENDSINYYREMWKNGMMQYHPKDQYMSYFFFHSGFKVLYEKDYLTEKEFNYMVLYLHYLGTITGFVGVTE